MTHDCIDDGDDEFENGQDDGLEEDGGEFDDGEADEERLLAIEHLELLMGDAQQRMEEADAGDLDPSDVYRRVFQALGWDAATIEAAIENDGESLEGQLWDHVGHRASATVLLERALEKVEGEMLQEKAEDAPLSP